MVPTDSTVLSYKAPAPNSSVDTDISVSELYKFVKRLDERFEAENDNPIHFNPKEANPVFLNEDGTPKVFYHGSKKNGGFTVFRDWQYFTEQKRYAETSRYGFTVFDTYRSNFGLFGLNYGDQTYLMKLYVEEAMNNKGTEVFTRAYTLKGIDNVTRIPRRVHSTNGGLPHETRAITVSVAELYDLVKENDKDLRRHCSVTIDV